MKELLKVSNLCVGLKGQTCPIVKSISFALREGTALAVVGESGSGKTMTCKSVMQLLNPKTFEVSGKIRYRNTDILTMDEKGIRALCGSKIAMIVQNPMTAFDPTPAAFYAHQASRNNYYEIALEMVESNFDYFAGGALKEATGKNKDKTDAYQIAKEAGYNVIKTQSEAEKLTIKDGKSIIIAEKLADSDSMSYANDKEKSEWGLEDYVKKGIEVLDNNKGFFMMVEGGKIDWACHANDAGSTIADTLALDEAVQEAVKFYNQHPNETLILVTGDHETGGLTIGYAGTNYNTYLTNLSNQKISYAKYDSDFVAKYKENKTSFETVLKDIKANFGLTTASDKTVSADSKLILTDYEVKQLKAAYDKTMSGVAVDASNQAEYVLYGTYEPLSVTITHILKNKSGINFSSYSHTGLPVGVFAEGVGEDLFSSYYDNTDIYNKLASLLSLK